MPRAALTTTTTPTPTTPLTTTTIPSTTPRRGLREDGEPGWLLRSELGTEPPRARRACAADAVSPGAAPHPPPVARRCGRRGRERRRRAGPRAGPPRCALPRRRCGLARGGAFHRRRDVGPAPVLPRARPEHAVLAWLVARARHSGPRQGLRRALLPRRPERGLRLVARCGSGGYGGAHGGGRACRLQQRPTRPLGGARLQWGPWRRHRHQGTHPQHTRPSCFSSRSRISAFPIASAAATPRLTHSYPKHLLPLYVYLSRSLQHTHARPLNNRR